MREMVLSTAGRVTIAEVLRDVGYFTAMTGKWHVGQNHGVTPWGRGFDRTLTATAGGFYFPDSPRAEVFLNGKNLGRNGSPLPTQWYSTDLWTEYGLKFVDEAREAKKPFFLYIAHNAPHFPLQAPPEDIARWRGKYKLGWDKLREARYQRQLVAAGELLVTEAGGVVTDHGGDAHSIYDHRILASNGLIHDAMVEVLAKGTV